MPDLTDDDTLGQAREWLSEQLMDKGATCPCCNQFARVYKRKLNANMARTIVQGYQKAKLDWFHAPTVVGDRGELAKLRYWGLVEEEHAVRPDGGRTGWWRITVAGERFVLGKIWVPAHALVYDSKLLRLDDSGGRINITDALGRKFNYRELMAS